MKRWLVIVMVAALLCGCGAQPVFERVEDTDMVSAAAAVRQVKLDLPQEAASPAMESADGGAYYQCDGYVLTVQTLPGGDLDRTLRHVTGFSGSQLQMIKTKAGPAVRYNTVWTAAGEGGDQVGRALILDDGQNHYAVTVMANAASAGDLQETWNILFSSVTLDAD